MAWNDARGLRAYAPQHPLESQQAVEESKLIGLMQRVLYLLGKTVTKPGEKK